MWLLPSRTISEGQNEWFVQRKFRYVDVDPVD